MKQFILYCVSFFTVVAVASCLEILSSKLEHLTTIEVSKFKCLSEGRFPHPNSCGAYVECVRTDKGNFKRRFGTCHGAIFSSKLKYCMASNEDNECNRSVRSARALATDRRFSNICSDVRNGVKNGFVCADCKTVVNCVEGVAYTESCGAGDMCAENQINFGGAVCYPSQPENCTCGTPNEFHVDNYNPQMFFFCDNTGSDPDLYHCQEDMKFDIESKQCISEVGLPECTETGNFADYGDCSQYYTCISSKDGWVQKSFSCVNDTHSQLMYNEETGECEDPCSWDTGEFTCQEQGRFADPLSCQHYYECIQDEGSFRQDHRKCPDGYEWDTSALRGHGHCMSGNTNTCNPVKVSKCVIPEGRCPESADITAINSAEIEEKISRLERKKAKKETEIEETKKIIEALKNVGAVLAQLVTAVFDGTRAIKERHSEILVVIDSAGIVTVSPYCDVDGKDTLQGTPDQILLTLSDNVRTTIRDRLDLEPCMNDIVLKLEDTIYQGYIRINDKTAVLVSLTQTIEIASLKSVETKKYLSKLQEEKTIITSRLTKLEAKLTIGTMTLTENESLFTDDNSQPPTGDNSQPPTDDNSQPPTGDNSQPPTDEVSETTDSPEAHTIPAVIEEVLPSRHTRLEKFTLIGGEQLRVPGEPLSPRARLWSILNRGDRRARRTVHSSSTS